MNKNIITYFVLICLLVSSAAAYIQIEPIFDFGGTSRTYYVTNQDFDWQERDVNSLTDGQLAILSGRADNVGGFECDINVFKAQTITGPASVYYSVPSSSGTMKVWRWDGNYEKNTEKGFEVYYNKPYTETLSAGEVATFEVYRCSTTIANICEDSDGGKNYKVKGRNSISTPLGAFVASVYDKCTSSTQLLETYCDPVKGSMAKSIDCSDFYGDSYKCVDGKCASTTPDFSCTPNVNVYCDGTALYNYDSCGNKGSLYSSCSSSEYCPSGSQACVTLPGQPVDDDQDPEPEPEPEPEPTSKSILKYTLVDWNLDEEASTFSANIKVQNTGTQNIKGVISLELLSEEESSSDFLGRESEIEPQYVTCGLLEDAQARLELSAGEDAMIELVGKPSPGVNYVDIIITAVPDCMNLLNSNPQLKTNGWYDKELLSNVGVSEYPADKLIDVQYIEQKSYEEVLPLKIGSSSSISAKCVWKDGYESALNTALSGSSFFQALGAGAENQYRICYNSQLFICDCSEDNSCEWKYKDCPNPEVDQCIDDFDGQAYCATWRVGECGDDVLQSPVEECDDGDTVSGDGCNSMCKIEDVKWDCSEIGQKCCIKEGYEIGETFSEFGAKLSSASSLLDIYESRECCSGVMDENTVCRSNDYDPEACGNGKLDTNEKCDPGISKMTKGCSDSCVIKDGYVCNSNTCSSGAEVFQFKEKTDDKFCALDLTGKEIECFDRKYGIEEKEIFLVSYEDDMFDDKNHPICIVEIGDSNCRSGSKCVPAVNKERLQLNKDIYDSIDGFLSPSLVGGFFRGTVKLFDFAFGTENVEKGIEQYGMCIKDKKSILESIKTWIADQFRWDVEDPKINYVLFGGLIFLVIIIVLISSPPKPKQPKYPIYSRGNL